MAMKSGRFFEKFALLTASMVFVGAVYAGSEPAPGQPYRLSQPSIKGTLVILGPSTCDETSIYNLCAHLVFVGMCQKEPVQFNDPAFPVEYLMDAGETIADITAVGLDGRLLMNILPLIQAQNPNMIGTCDTDVDMAITSVSDFVNRGEFVNATVTMKFAIPR